LLASNFSKKTFEFVDGSPSITRDIDLKKTQGRIQMNSKIFMEPARQIPVNYDVDVAVVGGGTAGCIAAIASARTGASTALVERFASLGGCPTVGRCTHLGNKFIDNQKRQIIGGVAEEVIRKVVENGGTCRSEFEEVIFGKKTPPVFFIADPEILSLVLMEMAEDAGVKLLLHTYFCDPILEQGNINGIIVQNKSGRFAIRSKNVIDASGEADVASKAGAPFTDNPTDPIWASTHGLVFRMGNMDHDRFMDGLLNLPAGEPRPEYGNWLSAQTGRTVEDLEKDWFWRHFLDPQSTGWGIPRRHPGKKKFGPETLEWFKERWTTEGDFSYVGIHFFRDQIKQAVENGDFELTPAVEGMGEMTLNFDGITGASWRKGEVVVNIVNAAGDFNAFNSNHISKLEIAARKRAMSIAKFLIKYIKGFEESYIVDMGAQTMTRHVRLVETEFTPTEKEMAKYDGYPDAVYMYPIGVVPGFARQIPYRTMIPKKTENLLVVGKCVKGSHLIRAIPAMMAMGHAAGTAAALSVKQGVCPRNIDVTNLQKVLRDQGMIFDLPMEPYRP
jgi:ribulose 1,5-bisphosphate synthetase/thiazole synthase